MPFSFYEKVRVTNSQKAPECNGKTGVVLGISEENGTVQGYGVHFPDEEEGYFFLPEELEGTGELADPREFYNESDRIRVRVVDGEAFIVEEEPPGTKPGSSRSDNGS